MAKTTDQLAGYLSERLLVQIDRLCLSRLDVVEIEIHQTPESAITWVIIEILLK